MEPKCVIRPRPRSKNRSAVRVDEVRRKCRAPERGGGRQNKLPRAPNSKGAPEWEGFSMGWFLTNQRQSTRHKTINLYGVNILKFIQNVLQKRKGFGVFAFSCNNLNHSFNKVILHDGVTCIPALKTSCKLGPYL